MKRVVVEHFGGPEVVNVVEDDAPRPGPGEVAVRVLASGVSLTDALLRAGAYLGGPKPPFTPGYELVGIVEEVGPGATRLRTGDRIGALTVWGANAERVCVPAEYAVDVPDDLDPAEVVSLVFPYMTAYQMLHRTARVKRGESILVHGAAGRVGTALLELGMYGTVSARDREAVERLGAVAIDYRTEDFVKRVRQLTGRGVDVVLDPIGGATSIRSFRALRRGNPLVGDPGGRLVVYGNQDAVEHGRRRWRGWLDPDPAPAAPGLVPRGLPDVARAAAARPDPSHGGRAAAPHGGAPRPRAAGTDGRAGEAGLRVVAQATSHNRHLRKCRRRRD